MRKTILKHLEPYIEQIEREAVERGRNEEKINRILTSFSLELPLDLIAKINNITVAEVKDILKQHNITA